MGKGGRKEGREGSYREKVDEGGEVGVAHFHALELRLRLTAADLELLDDVRDALMPVAVVLLETTTRSTTQR